MVAATNNILALDVGSKRIGVALANGDVRFPAPLTTLLNDDSIWPQLEEIIAKNSVGTVVIGLPRGLDGQETAQTGFCRRFAKDLAGHIGTEIVMQDEALTSVKAEEELEARGKPYEKGAIDALAATYILEDYLGVQA